jgi:DnaJ-domain-containing protein 1
MHLCHGQGRYALISGLAASAARRSPRRLGRSDDGIKSRIYDNDCEKKGRGSLFLCECAGRGTNTPQARRDSSDFLDLVATPMNFLKQIRALAVIKKKEPEAERLLLDYAKESDVEALFILLGMLAKADGAVSKEQIETVQKFMKLHLAESLHELAKHSFKRGKECNLVKGVIVTHAFKLYWSQSELWIEPLEVLDLLLRVAFADGTYSPLEEHVLDTVRATLAIHVRIYWALRDQLARRFGIEVPREGPCFAETKEWDDYHKKAKSRKAQPRKIPPAPKAPPPRETAYKALGLEDGAGIPEIKKAYRALVKKYHPDSASDSKSSELEYQQMAERFLEIQEAYETLLG